jgi:hypothetical protein
VLDRRHPERVVVGRALRELHDVKSEDDAAGEHAEISA